MEFLVSVLFFFAIVSSSLTIVEILTLLIKSYWKKNKEDKPQLDYSFLLVLFIVTDVFWGLFFHFV